MGRSQRHKVKIQGFAADGGQRANDVVGNTPVDGSVGGPLQGSKVQGPVAVAQPQNGWSPPGPAFKAPQPPTDPGEGES